MLSSICMMYQKTSDTFTDCPLICNSLFFLYASKLFITVCAYLVTHLVLCHHDHLGVEAHLPVQQVLNCCYYSHSQKTAAKLRWQSKLMNVTQPWAGYLFVLSIRKKGQWFNKFWCYQWNRLKDIIREYKVLSVQSQYVLLPVSKLWQCKFSAEAHRIRYCRCGWGLWNRQRWVISAWRILHPNKF